MIPAYLTIDDVPTMRNGKIVDYLFAKQIKATMFCWGEFLEKNFEGAVYALQHGMILQNHSYSHPHFSEITFEQACAEIEKNEELIKKAYSLANIERPFKMFRFPYGDQGGENAEKIQNYLRQNGFVSLANSHISPKSYARCGIGAEQLKKVDTMWTFDFQEYCIRPENDFTIENSLANVQFAFGDAVKTVPDVCRAPEGTEAEEIIIIHDHVETEENAAGYFERLIDELLKRDILFVPPAV